MKLALILGLLVMLVVAQACDDCSNEPAHKICGRNKFGFMSNYDNECAMNRFNCRFGSSYVKYKDEGCWDSWGK